MDFFNSKTFSAILILVIMAFALVSCTKPTLQTQGPKQNTTLETISKAGSIGAMLGCIFAPSSEECKKFRTKKVDEKPHKSQEEYDKENNKEWDNLEKDLKPSDQE